MAGTDVEVWKFGGASLADAAAIRRAAALVAGHDRPLVVVASALAGVTDLLLDGARHAARGEGRTASKSAAQFLVRHRQVVKDITPPGPARKTLLAMVDVAAREYRDLCTAIAVLGHLESRTADMLVSRGERTSANLLATAIGAAGRGASFHVDALDIIATDNVHGGAAPDIRETTRRARRVLRPLLKRKKTPVIPGFIGRAPDNTVATLGRGGSDLTATLLARALGSKHVVLWKDVPGILTADPRLVPDARLIPHLHHREAAEVAHYGAKVLHPRALIPIAGSRIVLSVRSFVRPTEIGTEVSARRSSRAHPVKAIATIRNQAIVTVSGKGMAGVHGIAARTFAAVDSERLSVSTIFQASSENSIGFTLPEHEATRAVDAIRQAFRHELVTGLIDNVAARTGTAVVAVVGDGMVGTPGVASRVFSALATAGINVVAIAQGSSERNISFVVGEPDVAEACRRVHGAFQLSKIGGGRPASTVHTDVVLLGFGRVGRALADQIATANDGPPVRVVGLVDRSGCIFEPKGLSSRRLQEIAREKDRGSLLTSLGGQRVGAAAALATIASHAVSQPVLVDVTSAENGELLASALNHGFHVAMANKKPLAGSWESYAALMDAATAAGRIIRYEATVGAGLPIIDTFNKLVETGDRVLRIDGVVSGTLMFVASAVSSGRPFSEAVAEAVERGYAEPDPRDDLSGQDVARKALILARMLGYKGAPPLSDNLVPKPLRRLPLAEFMKRLSSVDAEWSTRTAEAASGGTVLRYVVSATPRDVSARLVAVPASSPIGALHGTRNLVAFTTERYRTEPLVISGPGAGPAVTAAGILNDIYSIAVKGR